METWLKAAIVVLLGRFHDHPLVQKVLSVLWKVLPIIVGLAILGLVIEWLEKRHNKKQKEKEEKKLVELTALYPDFEQNAVPFTNYLHELPIAESFDIVDPVKIMDMYNNEKMKRNYQSYKDFKILVDLRNNVLKEIREVEKSARREETYWRNLPAGQFEDEVLKLFAELGYRTTATPRVADGGVDGILEKGDRKIIIQCKRWDTPVGEPTMRDLYGTTMHERADQGWVIATGGFSAKAERWARGKPLRLIDLQELLTFAKQVYPERFNINGKDTSLLRRELEEKLTAIDSEIEQKHGYNRRLTLR
jgi:HJR/Mrr/RecB family endonuclease